MWRLWKQGVALLALAAAAGLWCLPSSLAKGAGGGTGPSYQIVELDSQGNVFEGHPFYINNARLVVGSAYNPILDEGGAACWTVDKAGGTVTSTLHFLTDGVGAFGVNDSGEIVGASNEAALYWENWNTAPLPLPTPDGSTRSAAESINKGGVVCGWSVVSDSAGNLSTVALVWRVNVTIVNQTPTRTVWGPVILPSLSDGDSTAAMAVNENDTNGIALVVGQEFENGYGSGSVAALAWTVTSLSDGTLVASTPAVLDQPGRAEGVNKSGVTGVICGEVWPNALVWNDGPKKILNRSATITAFGGKKTCTSAVAFAINASGVIVGRGDFAPYSKAVVWPSASGSMLVLDKFIKGLPITNLDCAWGVNDSGEIVGSGWDNNRSFHLGFVAIPK